MPNFSLRAGLLALGALLVLSGLDQTLLSAALPNMAQSLGDRDRLAWVFSAYLTAATAALPLYGKLADRMGARPSLRVAMLLFAAGSMGSALADSVEALIAARAVQGLGSGGLMTLAMVAVSGCSSPLERASRMARLSAAYGMAIVLGPQLGAAIVQTMSWRWAFGLEVPLVVVAACVLWRAPLSTPPGGRTPFDTRGALLLMATVATLVLALRQASPGWVPLLALGFGAAWVWEARRAPDPVLPLNLFRAPGFGGATVLSAAAGVVLFSVVVFLPSYLQLAQRYTPSHAALHLLPMMIGLFVSSALARRAMRLGRSAQALAAGGVSTVALGCLALAASLAWASAHSSLAALSLLLVGLGLGRLFPVVVQVAQGASPSAVQGVATAVPLMTRSLGGAMAAALAGNWLARQLSVQPTLENWALSLAWLYAVVAALAGIAGGVASWAMPRNPMPSR